MYRKTLAAVKEPEDPEVKRACDKLAAFVAQRGRAVEDGARAKNPGGDTPFKFLHDTAGNDYRYYEAQIQAHARGQEQRREPEDPDDGGGHRGGDALGGESVDAHGHGPRDDRRGAAGSRWERPRREEEAFRRRRAGASGWDARPDRDPGGGGIGAGGHGGTSREESSGGGNRNGGAGDRERRESAPAHARYYRDPTRETGGLTAAARSGFPAASGVHRHTTSIKSAPAARTYAKEAAAMDPLRAMEFFARQAARDEKWREEKRAAEEASEASNALGGGGGDDRRYDGPGPGPSPAEVAAAALGSVSRPLEKAEIDARYRLDGTRGHHLGDFIPQTEMNAFLAKCGDPGAQAAAAAAAIEARIGSDGNPNKGADMMRKMGWTDGRGLGASGAGAIDPLAAVGGQGGDRAGLGASDRAAPSERDDIYEQYKKRMMLGYKHRPNPLGNPRKDYY